MDADVRVRLLVALVGIVVLLPIAALVRGRLQMPDPRLRGAQLVVEHDVTTRHPRADAGGAAAGSVVGLHGETVAVPFKSRELRTVPRPVPLGRLAVLREGGRLDVVVFGDRRVHRARVDSGSEEVVVVDDHVVVRSPGPDAGIMIVPPGPGMSALRVRGLPGGVRPDRLLPRDGAVQVWGRNSRGWSGATLHHVGARIRASLLPPLPPWVTPVAAGPDGLIAESADTTVQVGRDRTVRTLGPGAPVAVAGDNVVRSICRMGECAFRVVLPATGEESRIAVGGDAALDGLAAPRGVADSGGRRVAVSLLLKHDAGWRPGVLDIDAASLRLLPVVLPRTTPSDVYGWSADDRWLFVPVGRHVRAYSIDGHRWVLDLDGAGRVLDLAVG